MPWIDTDLLKRIGKRYEQNAAAVAREGAERRLDELEARLDERQRARGMAPIKSDTGATLGWVDVRPVAPREEFPR